MKYFKLNSAGTKWEECELDTTKRQIPLYDKDSFGMMVQIGKGLY